MSLTCPACGKRFRASRFMVTHIRRCNPEFYYWFEDNTTLKRLLTIQGVKFKSEQLERAWKLWAVYRQIKEEGKGWLVV